jgi:hypothetical protein
MVDAEERDGLSRDAARAIAECVASYAGFRATPNWVWQRNIASLEDKAEKDTQGTQCLLPTLEALWMFLQAGKLKAGDGVATLLPSEHWIEDLSFVIGSASECFGADPYLPVSVVPTDFVETAGRCLSLAAAVSTNGYLARLVRESKNGKELLDGLNGVVRKAVDFIVGAAIEQHPGCLFWGPTRDALFQKDRDSQVANFTHPYYALCALTGLYDVAFRSDAAIVDLRGEVRSSIIRTIKSGVSGLNSLYMDQTHLFMDNLSSQNDDVIPTVFALEALLRVWDQADGVSGLSDRVQSAIVAVVDRLAEGDLAGLRAFDRDAGFTFQANLAPSGERAPVGLPDHTTLGSVSTVLALGLDRISITATGHMYYAVMDEAVARLLARRNPEHKVWRALTTEIWYSSRAVESLRLYIEKRPVVQRTVTARELVGIIQAAMQSSYVLDAITSVARRAIEEPDPDTRTEQR